MAELQPVPWDQTALAPRARCGCLPVPQPTSYTDVRRDVATLVPPLPCAHFPPPEISRVLRARSRPARWQQCSPGGLQSLGKGHAAPRVPSRHRGDPQRDPDLSQIRREKGNRGEEETCGQQEGGGLQEKRRTHCQLGSCVCCLQAAANHSLQLK